MKGILYGTAYGVLASLMIQPAWAQTAPSESPDASASSPDADANNERVTAQPRSNQQSGRIREIIVTAQRFSETAQKTALIITALDSEQLAGVTEARQLQTVVPGVQLGNSGNVTQTYIRGVGSLNATSAQESAVAYNADGVFLYSSTMITPLLHDLQRVEILKGPQGTLYGRNASGGAVNIISRDASIAGIEGYLEGEYGNFDQFRAAGAVNLPLTQTLAVRVAGQHVEHDGYLSDGTDDQDLTAGRLRLLWEPSSAVTLRAGVDGSHADATGAGSSLNPNPTDDKFVGALDPRAQTGPVFAGGTSLLSSPPNPSPFFKDKQWSSFAQLDVDIGFATLTVLPAYRYEKLDYLDYVPGYADRQVFRTRQRSIETRLANRSDHLKWVLGAYYLKVKQDGELTIRNEANFQHAVVDNPVSVESYAFFGEATYSLTDSLRITGGLRYTNEKTRSEGTANAQLGPPTLPTPQTAAFNPFDPVANPTGELLDYYINGRAKADAVTWKVGAETDLSPDSMLFATVSRGFKGGGTYVDIPVVDSSFKPEYLTAFELGSRNRFLGNTLQVNAELFYWKLKDQQISYVGFNSLAQVTFLTANAGKAHMYGADLDVIWKATSNDTFHVGMEYLESEYDEFTRTVPSLAVLTTTGCAVSGYDPTPGSVAPAVVDCSGLPTLRSPKWSGSASYQHRFDLANGDSVTFDGDATFASSRYLDIGYTELFRQKSAALFNASLAYKTAKDSFTVTAWIRNIGNKRIMSGGGQFVDFYSRPTLLPPRTYGVTARYAF